MLPVFVYGTLRPGSWNHEQWLAPWLAAPCRAATLAGHVLHHYGGLPYVVPGEGAVTGDVATLDPARLDAAMEKLDELEAVDIGQLTRVVVTVDDGERAWMYVAGPLVTPHLGPHTLVDHGDWLRVA